MNIQIKSRFTGTVLFEHDCEGNSVRLTLELAIKSGANLSDADLSDAYLSGANLSRADLALIDAHAEIWTPKEDASAVEVKDSAEAA